MRTDGNPETIRPRLGVSACLLGHEVRYDGGHQRDAFVTDVLARHAELVPFCPEIGAGLGSPRESLRLTRTPAGLRLVARRSGEDRTNAVAGWASLQLEGLELDGFVVKKGSPTCGLERVRVYGHARPDRDGVGLFTRALLDRDPLLPVEEEGRLHDPVLRERFLIRIFARRRLRSLLAGWNLREAMAFQAREKTLLMASDPAAQRALGRLLAMAPARPQLDTLRGYADGFARAIASRPTRPRHVNALQHLAGFFKRRLSDADRRELAFAIQSFAAGEAPLAEPLTLVRHHAHHSDDPWVASQTYLSPFPAALMPARAF